MRPLSTIVAETPLLLRVVRRVPRRWLDRLPARVRGPLVAGRSYGRPRVADERTIAGPGPIEVRAYWLWIGDDQGPAASVFYGREEIMRLDGLRRNPHIHYDPGRRRGRQGEGEGRVYLPPAELDAVLDRIEFELTHNVAYCLGHHPRRAVRTLALDPETLRRIASTATDHLRALVRVRDGAADADG